MRRRLVDLRHPALGLVAAAGLTVPVFAKKEFPKFEEISKDYTKVVSTADGEPSMYTLYINEEDNQLLAELPRNFEGKRIFVATSIAGGSTFTGWQWADLYCYWTRVNDQLVLMQPELLYQAKGSEQIESSVSRTYSDRMILSVPIVALGPGGGPVVDFDDLLVGDSGRFALPINKRLTTVKECKAFPQNIEIELEGPGPDGRLTRIHYSISEIPKTDYEPREADERLGYFLTVFKNFAKDSDDGKQFVRYINRWNLKKRDPSLPLSPPEEPIVFYIEHTVPVKYRRYVRDGILEWNKAFEKIGIDGAIEVRQQDAKTGAFMDLDPEDVRYNFFRWITSERAFAMGPSRVNPETGEILDADIIFDDSMARFYALEYKQMIASLPTEDAAPETLAWLEEHPHWDPRTYVNDRAVLEAELEHVDHLTAQQKAFLLGEDVSPRPDSTLTRVVQQNRYCNYASGAAHQMNLARLAAFSLNHAAYSDDDLIDGLPEKFIAQIIKEIVAHEVGHTLGLRHNFKASSWKTLEDLNADVGEPQVGSVMDYNPINLAPEGVEQGDWLTPVIGPYDYWVIEFGYTQDAKKLSEIAGRVAEDGLQYATDEDTMGPDPLVNRFDLGANPMEYSKRQIALANKLEGELMDRAVQDGEPWYPIRDFYRMLLYEKASALRFASRFVGGTYINRDRKGDPNARPPLVPVEADKQRDALKLVIETALTPGALEPDPEILKYLATDKFVHWGNSDEYGRPEFPVHDEIGVVQRAVLLYLMNPSTLRRVYDNEVMIPADQDALTLPEMLDAINEAIWAEVLEKPGKGRKFTNRQPMVSSLRRNLQREQLAYLIDLSQLNGSYGPPRAVQQLAYEWMINLKDQIDGWLADKSDGLDDYSRAHLLECQRRLASAIDAVATYEGN